MTASNKDNSKAKAQQMDETLVLTAIANLTRSMEELQAQNQEALQQNANLTRSMEEENKELKNYIRKQLSATPLIVKQMLDDFITQLREAMAQNKSDKLSETIQELVTSMNNLSLKLEDTNMIQVQVNEQAMEAYEEIISQQKQFQSNGKN